MKTLLLALLLSLSGCAPSIDTQSMTAVRLEIGEGVCSGTVVAPTVILSAGHCFIDEEDDDEGDPAPAPTHMLVNGRDVKILAIVFDGNDHALVEVDFFFHDWASIGKQPPVGTHVHYWGNPAGKNFLYREGYVTNYDHSMMMLNINGFFGDSGAGIFDEAGNVVGVVNIISFDPIKGLVFSLMGSAALEFTPQQYMMMGL